jgi:hypothetical protein
MDMTFRDDECRIRTDNAPENLATIKYIAHNLIRKAQGKDSLRLRRKLAGWNDDFLVSLLAGCSLHPVPLRRVNPHAGARQRRARRLADPSIVDLHELLTRQHNPARHR